MTDPAAHTTRLFAAQNMLGWTTFNENERAYQETVRYLLDRVKELTTERDELLETAEYLRYRECSNCGW